MIWILCIFTLFFGSCGQKPQETHYKEIVLQAPQVNTPSVPVAQTIPADPHAGLDMSSIGIPSGMNSSMSNMFSWTVPQGWKEESGGGIRLATFHLLTDKEAVDCSIVTLGGMAGGLEANLNRWMGQLGLQVSDDNLKQLLMTVQNLKTKDGLEAKVFDFTNIQAQGNSSDKSMLAAMIDVDQTTVFVKMTGSIEAVKQNKGNFLKLLGSIMRR